MVTGACIAVRRHRRSQVFLDAHNIGMIKTANAEVCRMFG